MHRSTKLLAAGVAAAALVPAGAALAQTAPASGPGVPAGQIEFAQRTVQVTGSDAVPRFERTQQYLTTHTSHTVTTKISTGRVRFEGFTSPALELRYDRQTNRVIFTRGHRRPPYQTVGQEARVFAQGVAQGCWTAGGDTVFEGRSATLYKLVAATTGPCRGDAQVGQAIVDKATGAVLEREVGQADGAFKEVVVLERFGTLPLNRANAKLLKFHAHPGAKRAGDVGLATRGAGRS